MKTDVVVAVVAVRELLATLVEVSREARAWHDRFRRRHVKRNRRRNP